MNIQYISKADPIISKEPVNDAEIHIKNSIPEFENLKQAKEHFKSDAMKIADILTKHLPQGTRHQLLICLLKDSENLLRGV